MSNLRSVAEELEALLAAPTDTSAPQIDESYLVAAEPTQSPEATAAEENENLIPDLVRSIVEYAIRQAPSSATPKTIGEAIGEGVVEAVNQLKLDDAKVVEVVDNFLTELSESVRARLSTE